MNNVVPLKGKQLTNIPVDQIDEPEFALRSIYEESALSDLAESLVDGMLAPIIVTVKADCRYEIHAGTRRWKASQMKKFSEIPAFVIDMDSPVDLLMLALTENVQRQDLDPFEEARAFLRLVRSYDLTPKQIAADLKKGEGYVLQRIKLLSLPEEVQELVANSRLSINNAASVARLPTGELQVHYARKAAENRLSVHELASIIRKDRGEEIDVTGHVLTPEKAVGKTEVFSRWARKLPGKLPLKRINEQERARLLSSIRDLQTILRTTEELIRGSDAGSNGLTLVVEDSPSNHNQQWTNRELREISASDRPSDEVLSKKLGRSVGAIRGMRSKAK